MSTASSRLSTSRSSLPIPRRRRRHPTAPTRPRHIGASSCRRSTPSSARPSIGSSPTSASSLRRSVACLARRAEQRRRRGRRWPAGQACPRQPRRGRPAVHEHPRGGQVCQSQQPPRHHARATMLVRRHSVLSSPRPRPGAGGGADSSPHPQVQIPSLIQSAREHGLLITTFGTASRVVLADAHMTDGVCVRSSLSPVSSSAPLIREPSRLSYATSDFLAQTAAS